TTLYILNAPAPTALHTLSLHDALPISFDQHALACGAGQCGHDGHGSRDHERARTGDDEENEAAREPRRPRIAECERRDERDQHRSEEHTSELQSRSDLVCRLLLEKKKK